MFADMKTREFRYMAESGEIWLDSIMEGLWWNVK